MQIKVNSDSLSKSLRIAFKAIPAKAAIPIMESFKIEASASRMTITSNNGELMVKVPVKLNEPAEKGACAVPARRLMDYLSLLPSCEITITTSGTTMEVKWAKGSTKIQLSALEDFPSFQSAAQTQTMDIPAQELLSALTLTIPAVSKDTIRPVLTGIHFDIREDSTRVVATDSKTLTLDTLPCSTGTRGTFTLPAPAATLLKSSITKETTIARVNFDGKNACFNLGDVIIQTRLIEGKFPNYDAIIPAPKTVKGEILTNRDTLIGAIRRLASCSPRLKMSLSPLSLFFSAENQNTGTSTREDCDCNYCGEDMEVGLNPSSLLSILEHMQAETLSIELTGPTKPIIARNADDKDSGVLSLFMPVALG